MYCVTERRTTIMDVPKVFWKYYDQYRRKEISLKEYSIKAELTEDDILYYLSVI